MGSNPQLPFNRTNIENIQKIYNFIGSLIYYEEDAQLCKVNQFIRIKVHVDDTKALNSGLYIKREDDSQLWIAFEYENVSELCNCCGMIDHSEVVYPSSRTIEDRNLYGSWLKKVTGGSSRPSSHVKYNSFPNQRRDQFTRTKLSSSILS